MSAERCFSKKTMRMDSCPTLLASAAAETDTATSHNIVHTAELADYLAMAPEKLLEEAASAPMHCVKFLAMWYPDALVRRAFLERQGVEFTDGSTLANMGLCVIPNTPGMARAKIGRNVSIAPNVTLICDASANNGSEINLHPYVLRRLTKSADITICDEAWLGANVTVLPGVTIGHCCVIGAGAVVTKNTDDYGIYAGVPARKIGDAREWDD